jgi:uncharacterized protein YceH (UPF0502 family)
MNTEELSPSSPFPPITFEEARVLGCLMEKETTTPEYYPMTLNQLVAACNQSSNRDPVVAFDDSTVHLALEGLKSRGLVFQVTIPGARVQKFKHNALGKFPRLEKPTAALLCVLLLRGQQTAGELRQRTERLHTFGDLPSAESALKDLMEYREHPLVVMFPPGGGRKASSYAHLLCGPVQPSGPAALITPASPMPQIELPWKNQIEQELATLREEVKRLRELVEGRESPPAEGQSEGGYIP